MNDLEGLRALVTGGASGIGSAVAAALVDAGADVVALDRNLPQPADGQGAGDRLDDDRDATLARCGQEVWPQFDLGQHDKCRVDAPQGPAHRPGEIKRPVAYR